MKKKVLTLSSIAISVTAITVIALIKPEALSLKGKDATYSINLNAPLTISSNKTNIYTPNWNKIACTTNGSQSTSGVINLNTGNTFYNDDALNSISSIKATFTGNLKLTVTRSLGYDEVVDIKSNTAITFDDNKPHHFKFEGLNNCNISSLNISYGCNKDETKSEYSFHDTSKYENFWNSEFIHNETVCFVEQASGAIKGQLYYTPTKIDSIRGYSLENTIDLSKFAIDGRDIYLKPGVTDVPYLQRKYSDGTNTKMPGTNYDPQIADDGSYFLFTENDALTNLCVNISYHHSDSFGGTAPANNIDKLPNLKAKLQSQSPLTLVVNGDSISEGLWSSGYYGVKPNLCNFATGFKREIERRYNSQVSFKNTALRGMTSAWGAENASANIAKYNPDLAFIGFGMNDCGSVAKATYKANIQSMINTVRSSNPNCEFVLCASIICNPVRNRPLLNEYLAALHELESSISGVAVMDMTSFSSELLTRKTSYDIYANNYHHPNDSLVRMYVSSFMECIRCSTTYTPKEDYEPKAENNTTTWHKYAGGHTKEDYGNGIKITNMGGTWATERYFYPTLLDGLEFSIYGEETNISNSCYGFYLIGTDDAGTIHQDGQVATVENAPVFSTWQNLYGGQNRYRIGSTYSYSSTPVTYSSIKGSTAGLSTYDNGQSVNVSQSGNNGYHVKFEKTGTDAWYKVTMTFLDSFYSVSNTYNASGKTLITYFDASQIAMFNSTHKVYIYLFGSHVTSNVTTNRPTFYLLDLNYKNI